MSENLQKKRVSSVKVEAAWSRHWSTWVRPTRNRRFHVEVGRRSDSLHIMSQNSALNDANDTAVGAAELVACGHLTRTFRAVFVICFNSKWLEFGSSLVCFPSWKGEEHRSNAPKNAGAMPPNAFGAMPRRALEQCPKEHRSSAAKSIGAMPRRASEQRPEEHWSNAPKGIGAMPQRGSEQSPEEHRSKARIYLLTFDLCSPEHKRRAYLGVRCLAPALADGWRVGPAPACIGSGPADRGAAQWPTAWHLVTLCKTGLISQTVSVGESCKTFGGEDLQEGGCRSQCASVPSKPDRYSKGAVEHASSKRGVLSLQRVPNDAAQHLCASGGLTALDVIVWKSRARPPACLPGRMPSYARRRRSSTHGQHIGFRARIGHFTLSDELVTARAKFVVLTLPSLSLPPLQLLMSSPPG